MGRLVPLEDLELERQEWGRAMARAAERWVEAHAAGVDTTHIEVEQQKAERNWRRLTRRIERRRKTKERMR